MISRRSPGLRSRGRSPDRRRPASPGVRGRDRRDFRNSTMRRSRSPIGKARSRSPPLKRKPSPPKRSRESSRRGPSQGSKRTRSKSPVGSASRGFIGPDLPGVPDVDSHSVRSGSRFRGSNYEAERGHAPQFRGPEGSVCFDQNELKKIVVDIVRKPGLLVDGSHINRAIINPEEIAPVRRPDEGLRPIFMRPELTEPRERSLPPEEFRRIVAINPSRTTERERDRSHDRQRYSSPGHYERSRGHYSRENRSRSPIYETRRPSSRTEYVDQREKVRDDRRPASSRNDLRHDLDVRRREEERHYPERRPASYERESDLRSRIIEKRSEPHRREERDQRLYESDRDREKHSRSHHQSPPPRERRRASLDGRDSGKPSSREMWEKEHESDRRRRAYSREREEEHHGGGNGGGRERFHHEEFLPPYKPEFEPKMKPFYRHEDKEFIPMTRGRGGLPMRGSRGMPPMPRGRGGMIRGLPLRGNFRGGPGMMRGGGPGRGHFFGMRGFPPRFLFPPF